MGAYWLGVLSLPAAVLALAAAWLAVKAVGHVGERLLTGGLIRTTPSTPRHRRAAISSVVFAGRRVWMLSAGDCGLVAVVGLDHAEAADAAERMGRVAAPKFRARTRNPDPASAEGEVG